MFYYLKTRKYLQNGLGTQTQDSHKTKIIYFEAKIPLINLIYVE